MISKIINILCTLSSLGLFLYILCSLFKLKLKFVFMKHILTALLSIVGIGSLLSQNLGTAPVGEAGLFANAQGGNPMMNLVMMDLRAGAPNNTLEETVGTPYSTENFIKSKLFYGDEPQGDFYVRYNALNSIIEIKKTNSPEEEAKQLYADKNVVIKYLNKELRFTTYINKKEETKNGYLSLIHDGSQYKLYHRLAVKFSEGKSAPNSMVADIPNRFAHFEEFYYQKVGVDRIDYLPLKKGGFLKQLDKEKRDATKAFLKENTINLHSEADLIRTFEFINSL
jgi:hypothetical protein